MDQRPVIARAGRVAQPQMERDPVNIHVMSIWARQIIAAQPHTVTNQTTNTKHIMPNTNNAKSSKSSSSDTANSPSEEETKEE
jgi:hypothetical protein